MEVNIHNIGKFNDAINNSVTHYYYSNNIDTYDNTYLYSITYYSDYDSSTGSTSTFVITFVFHTWAALQIKVASHTIYIRSYWGARGWSSWKQLL